MQTNNDITNNKNIIVGPDYGQIIKLHTNGAIIEAFISTLFSKNTKFGGKTIVVLLRNMAILLFIKMILEDSKTYLDKFKFTDLSIFKYMYQRLIYSEVKYNFMLVSEKWIYNDKYISISMLTPFLEQKSIFITQPSTYYYQEKSYHVKVIITPNKITFAIPNIASMITYMESIIIHKNLEIIFNGKTTMSKTIFLPSGTIKLEPVQQSYAFPTKNYIELETSIKTNFMVDFLMKFQSVPYCVNFDGEPGTGKTTFGNHIASSGIFDRIIICNMVQQTTNSFNEIVLSLERQIINTSSKDKKSDNDDCILIIFDEIDKWLENYISNQIQKLRDEARGKKQHKDEKSGSIATIESFEKLTEKEEDDKKTYLKNEFFNQLYGLVDGHTLSDSRKYVIIFNTNNFEGLFLDANKIFTALRDRFQRYKFNKIGKSEIILYLKYINKAILNHLSSDAVTKNKKNIDISTISISNNYKESVFDEIPDDIKISYRTLQKVLRNSCYKIEGTVKYLAKTKDFELFQCASDFDIKADEI
jgi:DNA polymerase III delta prime subunit